MNQRPIETLDDFFNNFRDLIKSSTNGIYDLKEFKNYSTLNQAKGRLTTFLDRNIQSNVLDETIVQNKMIEWLRDKEYRDTFVFNKNYIVSYRYMPKL